MRTLTAGKAASNQRGFTYAMVLAAIVVTGILIEVAQVATWRVIKADREAELLFRGMAYRRAIESFYKANGAFPRELEDLLTDPRQPGRRHLRALYADPMAKGKGAKEWSLIRARDGGIAGVASTSAEEPLKRANFPPGLENFDGASSYSDWTFEYKPPLAPVPRHNVPVPVRPPVIKTS